MRFISTIRVQWKENGPLWTILFLLRLALERSSSAVDRWMRSHEKRHGLPGDNTVSRNRLIWDSYDWRSRGEEWSPSAEWKDSIITYLIRPLIRDRDLVVEIGPGAGRWSRELQRLAGRLILVDLSSTCIELCRKELAGCDNVEYLINDGRTLSGIDDQSVDFIWSFDAFVHIHAADIDSYVAEFARVLRENGRAVIHHGGVGRTGGGWRSRMTAEEFSDSVERHGLVVTDQFDQWGPHLEFDVRNHRDAITVIDRPASIHRPMNRKGVESSSPTGSSA
jgi:SAM-dependent methyltransferase